jgi:hypothetical protein
LQDEIDIAQQEIDRKEEELQRAKTAKKELLLKTKEVQRIYTFFLKKISHSKYLKEEPLQKTNGKYDIIYHESLNCTAEQCYFFPFTREEILSYFCFEILDNFEKNKKIVFVFCQMSLSTEEDPEGVFFFFNCFY